MNQNNIDEIKVFLSKEGLSFEQEVKLHDFSYFRSGGIVKLVVLPACDDELIAFARFMAKNQWEYKVVGDTSNLLFLDDIDYGVLLSMKSFSRIRYDEASSEIVAQSGATLPELSRKALLWGATGFEGIEGIPGTIGGGVVMNAGAYESEVKDRLKRVRGIKMSGEAFELTKKELGFSNRNSLIRKQLGEYLITEVVFDATIGDQQQIYEKMELYHAKRHKHQDFLYPTLGSLFSTRDIYSDIHKNDRLYKIKLKWMRWLFYSKKLRRETPINRRRLNSFVCNYLGWQFAEQPFSDKTLNCITNRGQHTDYFLAYIEMLRKELPESVHLENEIMSSCIFTKD